MTQTTALTYQSPQDYASAILAEPSRDRRNKILEQCPDQWRDQVRSAVETVFRKARSYRSHLEDRRLAARQNPAVIAQQKSKNNSRSSSDVGNQHLAVLRAAVRNQEGL